MEYSQTDVLPTQPRPPSLMNEVLVKNQTRSVSRNETADSPAANEGPTIVFNTGVGTFAETPDMCVSGAREERFFKTLKQ